MLTETLYQHKSADRLMKTDASRTEMNRGHYAARDPEGRTFAETLRSAQNNRPEKKTEAAPKMESSEAVAKIENKVKELKDKIDAMRENKNISPEAEEGLNKLEALLEKIQALIDRNGEALAGQKLDFGKVSIDITAFLEMIMAKLETMSFAPQSTEFKKFSEFLDKKLEEIETQMTRVAQVTGTPVQTKAVKADETASEKGDTIQAAAKSEGVAAKEGVEKVKVIDNRTQDTPETPVENKPVKTTAAAKTVVADQKIAQTAQPLQAVEQKKAELELVDAKQKNTIIDQAVSKAQTTEVAKHYNTFAGSVTRANMEALMQNVTGRALVTLNDGKSELKMNLTPPELGRMSMKFVVEDGMMQGKIVVSTPEAKELFDQNLGELQRQMQQAGINIGSIDVQLGQGSSDQQQAQDSGTVNRNLSFSASVEAEADFQERTMRHSLYESSINFVA